ncbi:MAG: hypothetical protein PHP57_13415 [Sideroxydans sp.]|nr:hypothetical protein [Sideroxydans sp.]
MAKVPMYDTPQVGASVAPVSTFQAVDAIDAGKQASQMGQAVGKLAEGVGIMQNNLAEANAKASDNQLADRLRTLMHDPDIGYMNQIGKSAVEGRETTIAALDAARKEMVDNISDPLHRQMFDAVADRRMQAALEQVDGHYAQQTNIYRQGQTEARAKGSAADMQANWTTWNQPNSPYATAKATGVGEVNELFKDASPEQREQKVAEYLAGTHVNIVNNMVSLGRTDMARQYMDANAKEIERGAPQAMDNLNKLLQTSDVKDQSLRLSYGLQGGLKEQIRSVDEMFKAGKISAEVRDATVQRAEHNWQTQKANQAEGEKSLLGAAQDFLMKNPDKTVSDLPPNLYNGLKDTGHLATIVSFAKSGRYDNDPMTWAHINSLTVPELAAYNPTSFYTEFRGKLDDAHMDKALAMIAVAQGGGSANHLEITTVSDRVKSAARSVGILPYKGTPNENEARQFSTFETAVDQRVQAFEQSQLGGKRKASPDELQKIIDGVLLDKVNVHSSMWFDKTNKLTPLLTEEEQGKAYVNVGGQQIYLSSIPTDAQMKYTQKLQQRGIPVTQERIAQLWAADKGK